MTSHPTNPEPDAAASVPAPGGARPRRKLALRLILGPLLAAGVLGLLVWDHAGRHHAGFSLLLTVAAGVALLECYGLFRAKGMRPAAGLAVFLAVLTLLMRAANGPRAFEILGLGMANDLLSALHTTLGPLSFYLAGLLVLLTGLVVRRRRTVEDLLATVFGVVYVWLPLVLFLDVVERFEPPDRPVGEAALFMILVSNKVSDSAAYLCGTFFGRHPMAPAVSPKKTWEGAFGGMLFGTGAGLLMAWLLMPATWGTGAEWAGAAVFSAALVAAGQLGDLVESALKRWAGVKDSAGLVPEFGGVLDMIDGFLISIPVAYLFLACGGQAWAFGGG